MATSIVAQNSIETLKNNVTRHLEKENNLDKIAMGNFILNNIYFHYSYDGNNINRYCYTLENINKT